MTYHITVGQIREYAPLLRAGDTVYLSGKIYSARDAAHKRMMALIDEKKPLPIRTEDGVIYYMGPTPARPGKPIGAAGPTTASRQDAFSPVLFDRGIAAVIGKGRRGQTVRDSMLKNGAIYFGATGGLGALMAKCITDAEITAWPDLGAEAIMTLTVKDMPLTVLFDTEGNDLYETGRAGYLRSIK